MSEEFSPFAVMQEPGHCGPCSLASCLFMLGIEATQRDVAWTAGKPYKVFKEGLDEKELAHAAKKYAAMTEQILIPCRDEGHVFLRNVLGHLTGAGPAILLVNDFEHWVAVVGYLERKSQFVIYDPKADKPFFRWGHARLLREAWCESDDRREPSQYFAILIRRKDGTKPVWRITEPWMRIHNRGSACTAGTIATDLERLISNARYPSPRRPKSHRATRTLAMVLRKYRNQVIHAILTWGEGSPDREIRDLRSLYSDYITCADACSLTFPDNTDHAAFVAGLTALLSAYWWGGEMEE